MVVVFTAQRDSLHAWQRWLGRTVVTEKTVQDAALTIVQLGKNPDWSKLQRKIGHKTMCVVAGDEVSLPQTRLWKRFDSARQREELLISTLLSVRGATSHIGLWDPHGRLQSAAWRLAQVYPRVTVWCACREKYRAIAQRLMQEQGASLEITQGTQLWQECPIMGAMEQPPDDVRWKGLLLLAGPRIYPAQQGRMLHSLRVELPQELVSLCPADVDAQEVFLALCREGDWHAAQQLTYHCGLYWDEPRRLKDAVQQVLTLLT